MRGLTDPSRKAATCGPTPPIFENRQADPVPSARSMQNPSAPFPHSVHARITWRRPTATANRPAGAWGRTGGEDRLATLHPLRISKDWIGNIQPVEARESSDR